MFLTVVFAVLFVISSGLIQHSELDQHFHDLEDKNAEFYHAEPNKSEGTMQKEPIFISFLKTDARYENLTTSKDFHSGVKYPSNDLTETEVLYDIILEENLETVGGEADYVLNNRLWEDFLDAFDEKESKSLPVEPLVRKTRSAMQGMKKKCMNSSETIAKTVVGNAELTQENNCSCKNVVTSFPRDIAVSTFVNTFIKTVQSSELLTITFNVTNATPEQFRQYKYRFIVDLFRLYGYSTANVIAAFSVRNMAKYVDVLLPQAMIQIYANYMANFLFAEGFLTADNAEKLSEMYCRRLEEYAKIHKVNSKSGYTPKFQAITEGETRFLQYFGDLSYSEAWELAFYYAHEWLLASLDYGTLKDLTA